MIKLSKYTKFLSRCFGLLISLVIISQIQSQHVLGQCSLIDNSRDALFITYDQTAEVKTDEGKAQAGLLLRLHNNSSCAVIITTGSYEKFLKPLPENPSVQQRIRREIEYDLPDGVLVPAIQYRYSTSRGSEVSVGGDNFYGFSLLGKRSILFEVPLKHLDTRFGGGITITFQYAWEQENRAKHNYSSVKNSVRFSINELPEKAKAKIRS